MAKGPGDLDTVEEEEFDTSDSFGLREWLGTFSYEKSHAIQYGAGIMFLAAATGSVHLLGFYVTILLWAWGVRASPKRSTKTGEKKDSDDTIDHKTLPTRILTEIRNKTHYFMAGGLVGDRLGWLVHQWTYGTAPGHYEHLPEIIRFALGGGVL